MGRGRKPNTTNDRVDCDLLETEFTKHNKTFTQIKRTNSVFMYSVTDNDIIHYEVFTRKTQKEFTLSGKTYPAKEKYPNDESFGSWAWMFIKIDNANSKYDELCDAYE